MSFVESQFGLAGRTALVLAGGGVLGSSLAEGFARAGARVFVADLDAAKAQEVAARLEAMESAAAALQADVLDRASLEAARERVIAEAGSIDILLSGAGGNLPAATTSPTNSFFDLDPAAVRRVVDLNLLGGAILPAQVFGKVMVGNPGGGSILFISSMNAFRPLTRIAGYSAAKAALSNFTQWLAVHLAQEHGARVRVNALAPGFFLTEQNRYLLLEKDGAQLTDRGRQILAHTPMARFGDPADLMGAALWLASDASRFVTGIVVPVDGGFSAYSGV